MTNSNRNQIYQKLVEETEMSNRLIRDKEYDVKFTGEELLIVLTILGVCNGNISVSAYVKIKDIVRGRYETFVNPILNGNGTIDLAEVEAEFYTSLAKAFKVPETEDQRKLRELKEKHAELGKAIEAMEKK